MPEKFPSAMPDFQLLCGGFPCQTFSALQEPEKDSEIRAALSSLNWRLAEARKPPYLLFENVPDCLTMTVGGHLRRSLTRWTDWGMLSNGNVLTAKILASPNQETACTLSDILMSDVEEKYFLSPKQQEVLFKPAAAGARLLPRRIKLYVLAAQSGRVRRQDRAV